MNVYNYIDDYGIYSFKEKKFNEVDAIIFSFLSYANFDEIMKEDKKCTIQEIGRMHLGFFPVPLRPRPATGCGVNSAESDLL